MLPNEDNYIHIAALIRKKIHSGLSDTEQAELDEWIGLSANNRLIYEQCLSPEMRKAVFQQLETYDSGRAYARIKPSLTRPPSADRAPGPVTTNPFWRKKWLPYAAAAVVGLAVVTWSVLGPDGRSHRAEQSAGQVVDYGPAGNKAMIHLSDGRHFELDEDQNKVYVNDGGITYATGENVATTEATAYATITTPRGGVYHLVLSDGTEVTLNAGSSLKYPTAFTGDIRQVELQGEAFFDVSHREMPFLVETATHTVEVLGTEFNVNAYGDENWAKTTLVEGSVRLLIDDSSASLSTEPLFLQPGQQGLIRDGKITASQADMTSELAWINGRFDFNGKKLRQVMREISRWYDVDIEYEGTVPDIEFFGGTYRSSSLLTILSILANSGISYRLEANRTLIIGDSN